MRKTIGTFALLVTALAIAPPLHGQEPEGGQPQLSEAQNARLDEQMADLTEQLALTDEQAVEVRKILEVQEEKRREALQSASRRRRNARTRTSAGRSAIRLMRDLQQETDLMLAEVLTEDQMAKFEEIRAAEMAEAMERRQSASTDTLRVSPTLTAIGPRTLLAWTCWCAVDGRGLYGSSGGVCSASSAWLGRRSCHGVLQLDDPRFLVYPLVGECKEPSRCGRRK